MQQLQAALRKVCKAEFHSLPDDSGPWIPALGGRQACWQFLGSFWEWMSPSAMCACVRACVVHVCDTVIWFLAVGSRVAAGCTEELTQRLGVWEQQAVYSGFRHNFSDPWRCILGNGA